MRDESDRLRKARIGAGYSSASDAARAMGVSVPGYTHHENGTRNIARAAARYARFYRVSLDWLVNGRGEMRSAAAVIPVIGICTAGEAAMPADIEAGEPMGHVEIDADGDCFALRIEGDSQWPRFQHGEIAVFGGRPMRPDQLVGCTALVQTDDGRRMLKQIARGGAPMRYTLKSHNAPDIEDVPILAAWRLRLVVVNEG
jgi:phage repressor protein C with HTH and peptisase S24 domain